MHALMMVSVIHSLISLLLKKTAGTNIVFCYMIEQNFVKLKSAMALHHKDLSAECGMSCNVRLHRIETIVLLLSVKKNCLRGIFKK